MMRELGGVFGIARRGRGVRRRRQLRVAAGVHRRLRARRSPSSAGLALAGALSALALPSAPAVDRRSADPERCPKEVIR